MPKPKLDANFNVTRANNDNPTDESETRPKTPGMLVEDRNAAVRTDDEGRQTIHKVPDRRDEADRQGVDESQI